MASLSEPTSGFLRDDLFVIQMDSQKVYDGQEFVENKIKWYTGTYSMTTLRTRYGRELTCRSSQLICIGKDSLICASDITVGMHLTPFECPVLEDIDTRIPHYFEKEDMYNCGMIVGLDIKEEDVGFGKLHEITMDGLRSMLPPCRVHQEITAKKIIDKLGLITTIPVAQRLELLAGILDVTMNLAGSSFAVIQMSNVMNIAFIREILFSLGCPSNFKENKPVSTIEIRLCDFLKLIKLGLPTKYFQVANVENPVDIPIQDTIVSVERTYVIERELYTLEKSQKAVVGGFLVQI